VAYFPNLKITRLNHHASHAIHHIFTTKTPPQNEHFSKTPLKNRPQTSVSRPNHHASIFS
jgi:hypothetical protein